MTALITGVAFICICTILSTVPVTMVVLRATKLSSENVRPDYKVRNGCLPDYIYFIDFFFIYFLPYIYKFIMF